MGRKKYQIDFALKFWRLTHWVKRIAHVAPFRRMAGLIASEKAFTGSFIPVREDIEIPPGVVAPRRVLEDYVTRACNRTIIYECPCRKAEGCEKHPRDLGCILLGEGSRDVDPGVGYQATVEQALAHIDRACESGLLPLVGHLKIDQVVFGVKNFAKLLTMCFCCRCCCILRSEMRGLVSAYPRSLVRLEGVRVEVTDGCVGCGECVPVCPIQNVRLVDEVAVIGEMCLGCGTCASSCSRGFITVTIRPGSRLDEDLKRRIEAGVDIE